MQCAKQSLAPSYQYLLLHVELDNDNDLHDAMFCDYLDSAIQPMPQMLHECVLQSVDFNCLQQLNILILNNCV